MQMTMTRLMTTLGLIAFLFLATVSAAYAHNGIDHDAPQDVQLRQELRFLLIKKIAVLLLQKQQMMQGQAAAAAPSLKINAEAHGGRTHIHIYRSGKEEDSFFLDGISLSDETAVIAAVVQKTGLIKHEVEAAISFPDEAKADHAHVEDESDHEHEEDDHKDHSSVHIMADGTVMDQDGAIVSDAVILADGTIKLSDGSIVKPEFDLR